MAPPQDLTTPAENTATTTLNGSGSTCNDNSNGNNNLHDSSSDIASAIDWKLSSSSTIAPKSECEMLYGPYPSAIPLPFCTGSTNEGRQGDIPDAAVIAAAAASPAHDLPADYRDVGTPDEWVSRDGRLVRLTGKHPFNCEPPASVLHQYQFITPSSLHYVRNHGACPKLSWDNHKLHVGVVNDPAHLVPNKLTLSMDDLVRMADQEGLGRELPVTLVCAGNRRKEQNFMRQTIGFNWGSAGVSTNVWKGVPLRELLLKAGVASDIKSMAGKHVEFLGIEDLPNKVGPGPFVEQGETWGKQVKYGTSIPLARAMNPAYDVLVAYQANGQILQPDHGFPVRLIIPGYIGGRMIKWLHHINVLPYESRNHYHYHDNRILPPHVTAEEALTGGWWYKPEYIFNELNINSAVCKPAHKEQLNLTTYLQVNNNDGNNKTKLYEIAGYAYTGGGRAVTRVEVSTDGGAHWNLATIDRKEKPTDYGMYWCWIWWSYEINVRDWITDFGGAAATVTNGEIWCRAWDESNNVQPDNPTWNLMGMGNNHVFRVKYYLTVNAAGKLVLEFEHPTQPGQQTGGWMTKPSMKPVSAGFGNLLEAALLEQQQQDVVVPENKKTKDQQQQQRPLISMQEVEKHNTDDDVWIIIKNKVYDCTEYLELHPGGADSITINAGADATEDFVAIHSTKATKMLEKYYIGDLDVTSVPQKKKNGANVVEEEEVLMDEQGNPLALNPKKKVTLKLQNKIVLSRDSLLLDFALPTPKHVLGLPTGKHVFFSAVINGETVLRRYTPISSNYDVGCVKFVIKAYRPCERFPEGGKMSQYVDTLKIGDTLDLRGPVGEFEYLSNGDFVMEGKKSHASKFNMMAGGTGITPCMQIAAEILRNPNDPTVISLIFACREEGDLLLRSTLEEWAAHFPHRFKLHYILSDSWPVDWKYSTGFVDAALFEEYLFEPEAAVYNLMCGPPIMIDKGCRPNLEKLGHSQHNMFSF